MELQITGTNMEIIRSATRRRDFIWLTSSISNQASAILITMTRVLLVSKSPPASFETS